MKTKEQEQIENFALTCPLLLTHEQTKEPYAMLEQFFSFATLGGYREELTIWFKNALSEGVRYQRASHLLFIHEQFLLLIQATFMIASGGLKYKPITQEKGELFGEWMVRSCYNQDIDSREHQAYNNPYWLDGRDREAPLAYLQKTLTIETVSYIRKGLKEWKVSASSEQMSLAGEDYKYQFELYELLQRIVEASYFILIMENRKQEAI